MADEVLSKAVCLLNDARVPLRETWHNGGSASDVDLEAVQTALRKAYGLLSGRGEEALDADTKHAAQCARVTLLIHYYADRLSRYAGFVMAGERGPEEMAEMLSQARQIVLLLESHLFEHLPVDDNVRSIARFKRQRGQNSA